MNNDPLPGSAKKKQRKRKTKNTPATPEVGTNISSNTTEVEDEARRAALNDLLKKCIDKYSAEEIPQPTKEARSDFDVLRPIISEFLEDFMVIGHTIDGQRIVLRYAATPAKFDALAELSKMILARMFLQPPSPREE